MKMINIAQVTGTITGEDAISDEIIILDKVFRKFGYNSKIFALNVKGDVRQKIYSVLELKNNNHEVIFYHYGGADDAYKYLDGLKCKKVLIYHNITPSVFFERYDTTVTQGLKEGREKLKIFPLMFNSAIADSSFNAKEILEAGFRDVDVLPIFVDFKRYEVGPVFRMDPEMKGLKMLFVGRISPNKAIEDLIMIFYYYKTAINKDAKFIIVGKYSGAGCRTYHYVLQKLIKDLNLEDVYFTGRVNMPELVGYYRWANIFLTMSRHEGFCVPLLEAMYFSLPVIANNSCAMPETLGDSGILVNNRNFAEIAELTGYILENKDLYQKIVKKQKERLKDFSPENLENRLISILKKLL